MARRFARRVAPAVLFGVCLGCSGKGSDPAENLGEAGAANLPGDVVSCQNDSRVDTYAANLAKQGMEGVLNFTIHASDPAPPAKGSNTFTVEITDADGAPVEEELTVDLFMPDHGHGTSVVPDVTFDSDTNLYTLTALYLFMAGVWRITLSAYEPGADASQPVDTTTFFFCIEG